MRYTYEQEILGKWEVWGDLFIKQDKFGKDIINEEKENATEGNLFNIKREPSQNIH
jgi:hypothetical protein